MNNKKRNQIFNYLYVIAIIMVIDDHTSTRIGFLSSIFPYNSFYMPMFVFISGYFYRCMSIVDNLKHKIKRLLIPYVIWNFVALLIAFVLDRVCGVNWARELSIKDVLRMFITGPLTSINGPAWFVIMLFWVSVIYNVIRNMLKPNRRNDVILTILGLLAGFVSVYMCIKGYSLRSDWWLFALKISFYIQFFHYGYVFKNYLERRLLAINKLFVCSICVAVNVVLTVIYGDLINFNSTSNMSGFNYWYLPVITFITGTVFWYEVMEFLSRKIGENSLVNFISRNTFVVMQIHLLFANIPNFYVYYQIKNGSIEYLDFDMSRFVSGAWFRYNANARLIGFFCALIGSIMVAFCIEKIKDKLKTKQHRELEY